MSDLYLPTNKTIIIILTLILSITVLPRTHNEWLTSYRKNNPFKTYYNTIEMAKYHIFNCGAEAFGFAYYHWNMEEMVDYSKSMIFWVDDTFYMSFGGFDMGFFKDALLTLHRFTLLFSRTPDSVNFLMPTASGMRTYGAFIYPIMVWNYVRFTDDIEFAKIVEESMLLDFIFMKSLLKDDVIYLDHAEAGIPDFVVKEGYITDLTLYFLLNLKILQQLYSMDVRDLYDKVQNAMINTMWDEKKGFFVDWIDLRGVRHTVFSFGQLYSIVFDLMPESYQRIMVSKIPLDESFVGRFWLYRPYAIEEMTTTNPDWNYANKIAMAYPYLSSLVKFSDEERFELFDRAINHLEDAIKRFGFIDYYHWVGDGYEYGRSAGLNYISNAGSWIAITSLEEGMSRVE